MLNFFLIVVILIVWPTIYYLYFKGQIVSWFQNRFVRDKPPAPEELPDEPVFPFRYDHAATNEKEKS